MFYFTLKRHFCTCEMTLTLFICHTVYLKFWHSVAQASYGLQNLHETHVLRCKIYSYNILSIIYFNAFFVWEWLSLEGIGWRRLARSQRKKHGQTALFSHFPESYVMEFANACSKNWNVFSFLLNIFDVLTTYLPYFVHSSLSK